MSKKFTVITGASSGIGYATAKAFAQRDKNLILIARRKDRLENLKAEIQKDFPNLEILIYTADLTQRENVYAIYDALKKHSIETWINNAGFGMYKKVAEQDLHLTEELLQLNIEAVALFSTLYTRDYHDVEGAQLINISSAGGYTMVPNAVLYCASKFFVSSFTEGLALELKANHAKMQAKVLAPAATETEFGKVANNQVTEYQYEKAFPRYHSSQEMAEFLLKLYDSKHIVGFIDRDTFKFKLGENKFNDAYQSSHNQTL